MKTGSWNVLLLVLNLLLGVAVADLYRWERVLDGSRAGLARCFALPARSNAPPVNDAPKEVGKEPQLPCFRWNQAESADYRLYIANLLSIGCPRETVEDIIRADVSALFTHKRAEALGEIDQQLWETIASPHRQGTDEFEHLVSGYREERDRVLRELLGPNKEDMPCLNDCELRFEAREYSFLSENRRAQLKQLEASASEAIHEMTGRIRDGRERDAAIRRLREEQARKTEQTLDNTEKQLLDLYASKAAEEVWNRLGDFEPTQEEFLRLYTVQRTAAPLREGERQSNEETERGEKLAENQYRTVLGEARYQELQLSRNENYRHAKAVVDRLELPSRKATEILGVLESAQGQARMVRVDEISAGTERQAVLASLQGAAYNAVQEILGGRAYQVYTNHAGRWLEHLVEP